MSDAAILFLGIVLGLLLALMAFVACRSARSKPFWSALTGLFRRDSLKADLRWLGTDPGSTAPGIPTGPDTPVSPVAADFRIEVRAGAVMPDGRRQVLTIDSSGRVQYEHRHGVRDSNPLIHHFFLSDEQLGYIESECRSSGIFEVASRDSGWVDGDFVDMHLRLDGREHLVSLTNSHDGEAMRLLRLLNASLPETMRISYSQLDGPDPVTGGP